MTRLREILRLLGTALLCLLAMTLAGLWLVIVVVFWLLEAWPSFLP